jgi:hypothetical protein
MPRLGVNRVKRALRLRAVSKLHGHEGANQSAVAHKELSGRNLGSLARARVLWQFATRLDLDGKIYIDEAVAQRLKKVTDCGQQHAVRLVGGLEVLRGLRYLIKMPA